MLKLPKTIKMVITDFDGIVTDNCVYIADDGKISRKLNFKDVMGFSILSKKSQLNKRQAVLQNAVGPLRLKSKYYYKKQMVGWGMQYERNIVSDLLLAS